MAVIRKITIEFGREFALGEIVMDNNDSAKVIGVMTSDGSQQWVSESESGEMLEDFALRVVKSAFSGVVDTMTAE